MSVGWIVAVLISLAVLSLIVIVVSLAGTASQADDRVDELLHGADVDKVAA